MERLGPRPAGRNIGKGEQVDQMVRVHILPDLPPAGLGGQPAPRLASKSAGGQRSALLQPVIHPSQAVSRPSAVTTSQMGSSCPSNSS